MRSCIFVAEILLLGSWLPLIASCSSRDETPAYTPYTPSGTGTATSTNTTTRDSGLDPDTGVTLPGDCSVSGTAGCPCTEAGATSSCGRIDYVSGDYVTCIIGTSTCDGTQWGTCEGNRIVAQNHRGHSLTASGIQLLSLTQGCDIPCDPACTKVTGQQTDVDAGNLTFTDAGISITGTTGAGPGSGPCKGLWCQVQSCQGKPKTSLSGKVYDPAGKNPLYNAYVFIPVDPTLALPAFTSGASCDTCSGASAVSAISLAQTGPDGSFTLNNVPAGDNVALVVQMGKWRRMIMLPTVTACTNNTVVPNNSRLPRNHTDGYNNVADIPKIAIASGSADPFECLLLKAGIDANEIKAPGNSTRVEYYVQNGIDRSPGGAPAGSKLTGDLTNLKTYDVVLLPCEGAENDGHLTDVPNLASFADIGGRIFTTHYGYSWLATPSNGVAKNKSEFYVTADWSKLDQQDYNDPMTGTVDQSFPKGLAYAQWLQNVGATTTQGALTINEPRHDARSAKNPPSQRWVYGSSKSATGGTSDMLLSMTFNTPTAATQDKQCGRVVYSDFHVSADALVNSKTTACGTANDCGFGAACNSAKAGTCSSVSCKANTDCASGYSCAGSAQGSCTTQTCYSSSDCGSRGCNGGALGTCKVPCFANTDCSSLWSSSCSGAVTGTCSAATCKLNTDCGVGTCSGAAAGACVPTAKSCFANSDCTSLNASATCGGAVVGACSAATCRVTGDCGTGSTCTSPAPVNGSCKFPATSCWANADCTGINASATCSGEKDGTCSAATCKTNAECGAGTCTSPAPKSGSCAFAAMSCWTASDCTGVNSASCGGVTTGNCSTLTCKKDADCGGTGSTCNNPVPKSGNCTMAPKSCYQASECTNVNNATCSGNTGTCAAATCKANTDCGGSGTCTGAVTGHCYSSSKKKTNSTLCWSDADCTTGTYTTCQNPVLGSCSQDACTPATAATVCGASRACNGSKNGTCSGGAASCFDTADCSSLGSAFTCSGGSVGTCTNPSCTIAANCGGSRTCTNSVKGTCSGPTPSCINAADCTSLGSAYSCNGGVMGTCTNPSCTTNASCGGARTCVNPTQGSCVGPTATCLTNSDCSSLGASYSCSGGSLGTCTKPSCTSNSACTNGRTCVGAVAGACGGPSKTCWGNTDCSSLGVAYSCSNPVLGSCSSVSCTSNANCGGGSRTCQNAKAGSCSSAWFQQPPSCDANSDCTSWSSAGQCSGATAGTCNAATCYATADCGTTGTCNNGKLGACQDTCSTNADCSNGLVCVSGLCTGCLGSGCPSGSSCSGYVAGSCSASGTQFPLTCRNGDLSAQEKALEFMLFDLSACVSPDSWTPPVPGIQFAPVTFNLDFMANCPSDKRPIWREFDFQAQIPNSSTIVFVAQTADTASGLTAAQSAPLATATSSTDLPNWDVAIVDTTTSGAFQKVNPPIVSKNYLRVATTLTPTTDLKASPTLLNWEVHYDCVFSQ